MRILIATIALLLAGHAHAGYFNCIASGANDNQGVSNLNVYGSIVLKDTVWDDLRFPATVSDAGGLTKITWNSLSNSLDFADTCTTNFSDDHLAYVVQFPHNQATNTPVNPHVHFYQNAADQTNWMWYARYRWTIIGGTVGPWVDHGFASNVTSWASGAVHAYSDFLNIDLPTNMTPSTLMDVGLWRAAGVGSGKVSFKEFDIHYQADRFGTANETSN